MQQVSSEVHVAVVVGKADVLREVGELMFTMR